MQGPNKTKPPKGCKAKNPVGVTYFFGGAAAGTDVSKESLDNFAVSGEFTGIFDVPTGCVCKVTVEPLPGRPWEVTVSLIAAGTFNDLDLAVLGDHFRAQFQFARLIFVQV